MGKRELCVDKPVGTRHGHQHRIQPAPCTPPELRLALARASGPPTLVTPSNMSADRCTPLGPALGAAGGARGLPGGVMALRVGWGQRATTFTEYANPLHRF